MPIYNGIEFIAESVRSVLSQTYQEWELIIAVNGHPKNSEVYRTAQKYERDTIQVIDRYDLSGKATTLNAMLQYARYDWIALLDVDDIWLPKKLASQIPYTHNYDVIGTHCTYFGEASESPSMPVGNLAHYNFLKTNPIINSSCVVRKKLCRWREGIDGVEDYDLWLKLWTQKATFYNVSEQLVLHRIHRESYFNAQGNLRMVKKMLLRRCLYSLLRTRTKFQVRKLLLSHCLHELWFVIHYCVRSLARSRRKE